MKKNQFVKNKVSNEFIKNCGYEKIYPSFNFTYYNFNTKYFTKKDSEQVDLFDLMKSLKVFSTLKWEDIKKSNQFHFHTISTDKEVYKDLSKVFADGEIPELYQFKLQGTRESRVIGFFDEKNIFSIFVYDKNHLIYKQR